jgi:putative endonuclease
MSESHDLGQTGEDKTVFYLSEKGYRILRRNWKAGKHEIDIIAETDEFIVFVEVKTRSEDYLVNPSEAVTRDKQRSIIFAADTFIRINNIDKESRFDIIQVFKHGDTFQIDHIENAFYPTLR